LNADKNGTIVSQTSVRTTYEQIVKDIEADDSVSPEAKKAILSKVLNGRWFSEELDKHFGTPSLWPE
jgi:para-nitrobenzyl esterase